MNRGPKRKTNGQHFTPDGIYRLMAALNGPPKPSGFTHIGDPACGSGAMMLGYEYTYSHTKYPDVIYHLQDVDIRCVYMAYIHAFLFKLTAVITQNIDGLHQMAGSKKVLELHGSVHRNYCQKCHKCYSAEEILAAAGIPRCTCGGLIKPDVVLYEEQLDSETIDESLNAIIDADMLIVAGTSLTVYPAASLIHYFHGRYLVLINRDPTPMDDKTSLTLHSKVGEVLSQIIVR